MKRCGATGAGGEGGSRHQAPGAAGVVLGKGVAAQRT